MFNNTKLMVEGMNCAHCKKKLEEAVLGVEGVKSATANFKNNTLVFDCGKDEKIISEVKEVVTSAGFKVV